MAGKKKNSFKNRVHTDWAVPSWVIPGSVTENARFLAGKTPGIALCLFETAASLAYDSNDLPASLAALPLSWHIHLPLDLPWKHGAVEAAAICTELCVKTAFLAPMFAVLHPPAQDCRRLLADFAGHWQGQIPILLENTASCDIISIGGASFLSRYGFGFCMDVGHALGYAQVSLLDSALPSSASIWHWSAPGTGDRHLPLTALAQAQKTVCAQLMAKARPDAIHVLEIFNWPGILASLPDFTAISQEEYNDVEIRTGTGLQAMAYGTGCGQALVHAD